MNRAAEIEELERAIPLASTFVEEDELSQRLYELDPTQGHKSVITQDPILRKWYDLPPKEYKINNQ